MERVWMPPPVGFAKINIFVAVPEEPVPNGNLNGISIIIRDHNGFLIWGIMGPVKDLNLFQVQLGVIHLGMKEAYARGYGDLLIETEHEESFQILKR